MEMLLLPSSNSFIDFVIQTVSGMQTEIAIFIFAFLVHAAVFSKQRIVIGAAKKRDVGEPHDLIFKDVWPLVRDHAGPHEIAAAFDRVLHKCPKEIASEALVVFLQRLGKVMHVEVLVQVRAAQARHNLCSRPPLDEALLRSHIASGNVKESMACVESMGTAAFATPEISLIAMRIALQSTQFEAAVSLFRNYRTLRSKPTSLTPGEIQQSLLHMARYTSHAGKMEVVLPLLESPPPSQEELDVFAMSAVRHNDAASLQAVNQIGCMHNMNLCDAAFCVLIKQVLAVEDIIPLLDRPRVLNLFSDQQAFQAAVRAALQFNRNDLIKRLVQPSSKPGNQGSFILLIKSFISEWRLDDAFLLFRATEERPASFFNALLEGCFECKRPHLAEELMKEVIGLGIADVVTFNTMLKVHASLGNCARVRSTPQEMRTLGLVPNYVTFHEMMDARAKFNDDEIWATVEEMQACGFKPNHVTGSILLKRVHSKSKASHVERIMALIDELDDETDEVLLGSVVEACVRVGKISLLKPHLQRQRTSRRVQITGAHTFGSIIRAFGFVKDIEGIWETWGEMRSRGIVPTSVTLGCMVEAVVTNESADAGYELVSQMLRESESKQAVNAVVYGSILKGYSRQKRFDKVWKVYEEMLDLGVMFSIVTCNTIVDACARCGEMQRVPGILETLARQGIEPNLITYSAILKGYCQESKMDNARQVIESMRQTTMFVPDEIMYNTLLDGCARGRFFEQGLCIFQEMKAAGIKPSNFTLSVLVKLAGRCKRLNAAFTFLNEVPKEYGFHPNEHIYANVIHACVCEKDLGRGIDVLKLVIHNDLRPDSRMYTSILNGCICAGLGKDAAAILRSALGLPGGHARLVDLPPASTQPHDGLSEELVSTTIEGIASQCRNERLALNLLRELKAILGLQLDPRLQLRLATGAISNTKRGKSKQPSKCGEGSAC